MTACVRSLTMVAHGHPGTNSNGATCNCYTFVLAQRTNRSAGVSLQLDEHFEFFRTFRIRQSQQAMLNMYMSGKRKKPPASKGAENEVPKDSESTSQELACNCSSSWSSSVNFLKTDRRIRNRVEQTHKGWFLPFVQDTVLSTGLNLMGQEDKFKSCRL